MTWCVGIFRNTRCNQTYFAMLTLLVEDSHFVLQSFLFHGCTTAGIHPTFYYETWSNGRNSPQFYVPTSCDGNSFPVFAWHFGGFFWLPCQEKVLAGLRERLKNKVREAGLIGLFGLEASKKVIPPTHEKRWGVEWFLDLLEVVLLLNHYLF